MTKQRDLKQRIRDRMAKTGESYTIARKHVLAKPTPEVGTPPAAPTTSTVVPPEHRAISPPRVLTIGGIAPIDPARPMVVVEPIDISDIAAKLELRCEAMMFPELEGKIEPEAALAKLRDLLRATDDDPDLAFMSDVVLHGKLPQKRKPPMGSQMEELRRFIKRVQAGLAGTGPGGWLLALDVAGEMVVFAFTRGRAAATTRTTPMLVLHGSRPSLGAMNSIAWTGVP